MVSLDLSRQDQVDMKFRLADSRVLHTNGVKADRVLQTNGAKADHFFRVRDFGLGADQVILQFRNIQNQIKIAIGRGAWKAHVGKLVCFSPIWSGLAPFGQV